MKLTIYCAMIVISLTTFNHVLAVSGTCSSHGGVNCAAGFDTDGSAVCNDGWRDSTEKYSNQNICGNYEPCPVEYMATQSYFSCASTEQLETLKQSKLSGLPKLNQTTERGEFQFENNFSSEEEMLYYYYGTELNKCQEDIERFERVWREYNECLDRKHNAWANSANEWIEQGGKNVEKKSCPINSTLNSTHECKCNTGFTISVDQKSCVTYDEKCSQLAPGSFYNFKGDNCICKDGDYYDKTLKACKPLLKKVEVTPVPEKTIQKNTSTAREPAMIVTPQPKVKKTLPKKEIEVPTSSTKIQIDHLQTTTSSTLTSENEKHMIEEKPIEQISIIQDSLFSKVKKTVTSLFKGLMKKLSFWK